MMTSVDFSDDGSNSSVYTSLVKWLYPLTPGKTNTELRSERATKAHIYQLREKKVAWKGSCILYHLHSLVTHC